MIVNERIARYIQSLEKDESPVLEKIGRRAREKGVPVIRRETESFLRVVIRLARPEKILEVGAAVAYSAIFMSECMGKGSVVTIENYPPRVEEARANIKEAGKEDSVRLIDGDALTELRAMNESFDMIFLDAAKAQYINYLPEAVRLLKKGGVLIADNVLQDGDLTESKFAIPRRDRTIHTRMREYVYQVKNHPDLDTCIVPVGDGVTFSVKKR